MDLVVAGLVGMAVEVLEVGMELEYCHWNKLGLAVVDSGCMVAVVGMECILRDLAVNHHRRRVILSF